MELIDNTSREEKRREEQDLEKFFQNFRMGGGVCMLGAGGAD